MNFDVFWREQKSVGSKCRRDAHEAGTTVTAEKTVFG
jgi:hypothetical protein